MQMNLPELIDQFGSEDECHAYLEELRWPDGIRCPRCESDKISRIKDRRQFDCDNCRYQFSVRVGTLFHDSKLPLWKWFLAVYLICEAKKGISAAQLGRTLHVAPKTSWYLCHRIRAAMKDEGADLLDGIVEIDETFVGGKPRGHRKGQQGYRGNKTMIIGAIERGGKLRVQATDRPHATQKSTEAFVAKYVADDAEAIYTDSAHTYHNLGDEDTAHESVDHSMYEWVRGQIHTNTVESAWSLFDRAVMGSYHKLSVKHLPAYLDEFAFRFNNRENPYLFRDTILKLVEGDSLPYKELVASK
jgi:transposase-like protein